MLCNDRVLDLLQIKFERFPSNKKYLKPNEHTIRIYKARQYRLQNIGWLFIPALCLWTSSLADSLSLSNSCSSSLVSRCITYLVLMKIVCSINREVLLNILRLLFPLTQISKRNSNKKRNIYTFLRILLLCYWKMCLFLLYCFDREI